MPIAYEQSTVFYSVSSDKQLTESKKFYSRVEEQLESIVDRISQIPEVGLELPNGYFVVQMPNPGYAGMCTLDVVYRFEPDGENLEIHAIRGI